MKKWILILISTLLMTSCFFIWEDKNTDINIETGSGEVKIETNSGNIDEIVGNEEELVDETIQEIEDLFDILESK